MIYRDIELRPHARQGKAYYDELRAILKEEGYQILDDIKAHQRNGGKLTVRYLGYLALKHRLNCKATFEFLEDKHVIPCGTYDRVIRNVRPTAILDGGYELLEEPQP